MYAGADYETSGLKNDMPDYELDFCRSPKAQRKCLSCMRAVGAGNSNF